MLGLLLQIGLSSHAISATPLTGPPIAYGQWNATLDLEGKSVINDTASECGGVGWTCSTIAEDDGFLYQIVQTDTGETYTRMINLDPGTVGDASTVAFSTEAYTARQNRRNDNDFTFANDNSLARVAQGLASRQIIRDGALETTVDLQNGYANGILATNDGFSSPSDPIVTWCAANDPGNPNCEKDIAQQGWSVKIVQSVHDTDIDADFSNIIYHEVPSFASSAIQTDVIRGQIMDIAQIVTDLPTGTQNKFDSRKRKGRSGYEWFCIDPWQPCNTEYNITTGGSVTLAGNTVNWNAGGDVNATWVASNMGSDAPFVDNGFMLTTVTAGASEATEQFVNAPPTSPDPTWLAGDPLYDLNWPVETTNIADPFAGHSVAARTSPPTF